MHLTLSVVDEHGNSAQVAVRTRGDLTVGQLTEHLDFTLGLRGDRLTCNGNTLSDQSPMQPAGLRTGSLLGIDCDTERRPWLHAPVSLDVISGPDCGMSVALDRGNHVLGRTAENSVVLADPDVSRAHAEVRITTAGVHIRDLGSTNGTTVERIPVGRDWNNIIAGTLIEVGRSVLLVSNLRYPPAALRSRPDGSIGVNRPPLLNRRLPDTVVTFPTRKEVDGRFGRADWLTALLPACMGVGLAAAMRNAQFLAFALIGPLSMITTMAIERRTRGRTARSERSAHAAALAAAESELAEALRTETEHRRQAHPDACAVARTAGTPDSRIWERRIGEQHFLTARVGTSDQPATTKVSGPASQPLVACVPVVVALTQGPLGIAGPRGFGRALARWVTAQLLASHSPSDLSVLALIEPIEDWRWLRWSSAKVHRAPADRREAVEGLLNLIASRRQLNRPPGATWEGSWVLVLIDLDSALVDQPGLLNILRDGASVGVTAVCLANEHRELPHGCATVVSFHSADPNSLEINDARGGHGLNVTGEGVAIAWAEQLGRDLAPLHDTDGGGPDALPEQVNLLAVLGVESITPQDLIERWRHAEGASTAIGAGSAGTVRLDLVRDGPHALIAGSTGAGKSELLRTLVAGLAVDNSPRDMTFVLIDYKGGAAFAECADLPHTVAVVTDLDPHLTRRALISLNAELRRREEALFAAKVSTLQDYRRSTFGASHTLARLVIVVDEFAALAEELPDFIDGLIGIAQRGRSLGVHLILATQRPNGVVSPEIKANAALRIALRVIDPAESADLIGTGAAALIDKSRPGRAIIQLADGLTEFQTARIGVPVTSRRDVEITVLDRWNCAPVELSAPDGTKTDLHLLRDTAREAAILLGELEPRSVWMAPLPAVVTAASLASSEERRCVLHFGLLDTPEWQSQSSLVHDLEGGGSIGFIGGPRSGRSTALRTVAGIAATQLADTELHLYVLDCAGGSLLGLRSLRQCASYLSTVDFPAMTALVERLSQELDRRQATLAQFGCSGPAEARDRGLPVPSVLIVLDGWEGFTSCSESLDAGRCTDTLLRLLRDGASAGFTVMISGDRGALGVRIGAALNRKYVLPLTDPGDYAAVGIDSRSVPSQRLPGRGISVTDSAEFQLAVLGANASTATQWEAIAVIDSNSAASRPQRETAGGPSESFAGPIQLRPLATSVRLRDLDPQPDQLVLGVGGDEAGVVTASFILQSHSRFLIAGPARSGRSNAAALIAAQTRKVGRTVLVAAPARSPLHAWAREHDMAALEPSQALNSTATFDLIVIDDAEAFTDTVAGAALAELIDAGIPAVATARPDDVLVSFRGLAVAMRRDRTGLLLSPSAVDGEIFGIAVARRSGPAIAGRGVLVVDEFRRDYPNGMPIHVATTD